jgi:hypothetical protein
MGFGGATLLYEKHFGSTHALDEWNKLISVLNLAFTAQYSLPEETVNILLVTIE